MKTPMAFALARIEMLYIEKDSVHWEMFKNDCLEKEKNSAEKIWNDIFNNDTLIYNDFESYWNNYCNPKKEELLSLLAKQAQELDLGYEEFELGGEG
jgi:hypothetical protein